MNPSPRSRIDLSSPGDEYRARVSGGGGPSLTRSMRASDSVDSTVHEARRSSVPSLSLLALLVAGVLVLIGGSDRGVAAHPCGANEIVCENQHDGSPSSEWDISGAGDPLSRASRPTSASTRATTVEFKVDTDATAYRLDIYRWATTAATARARSRP